VLALVGGGGLVTALCSVPADGASADGRRLVGGGASAEPSPGLDGRPALPLVIRSIPVSHQNQGFTKEACSVY